jgi:hypothetical protein
MTRTTKPHPLEAFISAIGTKETITSEEFFSQSGAPWKLSRLYQILHLNWLFVFGWIGSLTVVIVQAASI